MPVETISQRVVVLYALMRSPHTVRQLTKLGILSVTKAISDLRKMGFAIVGEWVKRRYEDNEWHRVIEYHYIPKENDLTKIGEEILRAARSFKR